MQKGLKKGYNQNNMFFNDKPPEVNKETEQDRFAMLRAIKNSKGKLRMRLLKAYNNRYKKVATPSELLSVN